MKSTLATLGLIALSGAVAAQQLSYPVTRKVDQQDVYHGQKVADPYRWLEDDNSAETKAWVAAQNEVTNKYLAGMPQRAPVKKLYTELYNYEKFGLPFKRGGHYFWTRNDGLQQQAVLYTADRLDGTPRVAFDPNTLSADGTKASTGYVPSEDGKLLAYGVAAGGSDWQIWRVRDLTTGKDLSDQIDYVKFSSAAWTKDGKGFFYSRYDAPAAGAALTGANYFHKLYYHQLGTKQEADQLVAENKEHKDWGFGAEVTDDGQLLVISVWTGGGKNGLMTLALPGGAYKGGAPVAIASTMDMKNKFSAIGKAGNTLFVNTDQGASRGRIVSVDLKAPQAAAKTVVAENGDALSGAQLVGGRLVLEYLHDAASRVTVHGLDGKQQREVALPGVGSAAGFGGNDKDPETFFSYGSLTTPTEVWRYDVATGKATLFKRPKTAFNPDDYETHRVFVTSKDGTKIPLFVAHKKGMPHDGSNPTLLYGYGGFNVNMTPGYSATIGTWLKMGGVYVMAVLRGGGEYGEAWHEAGTKLKKQNVFDDFIAAAEWAVDHKITTPARLAVNGGSNGGLLVGAVVNQRPELFGAAIPQVGVMDMLRFHNFTIGWAWKGDYGSSEDAQQFKALQAYSPLHNIRSQRNYPAIMATTADHDDRVVPAHTFKYTAALQAADTGPAPKIVRIETQAGHGAGKPTSKLIEERADMLAFIANVMKLDVQ